MRAVISSTRGAPRARPPRVWPGRLGPSATRAGAGGPAASHPPGGRGADDVPDDGERRLAAARTLGHHPVDGRRGTTVATDRARAVRATRGRSRHESPVSLDLSTGIPDSSPAARPRAPSSPPGRTDDAEQLPRRPGARPSCAPSWPRDWPYAADDLLVVDGAMDALDLVTRRAPASGRPRGRGEPRIPAPARPAGGPRGRRRRGAARRDRARPRPRPRPCSRRPAAVCLQPRGQNPTGVSMHRPGRDGSPHC